METIANRYRVLKKLGQGGMGKVFSVADTLNQDQEVALKILENLGSGSAENAILRFKDEFQTMVKLRHPNTIHVYNYGVENGQPYLTMEIVPGRELTELIAKVDWKETCQILIQLCQALGFIHSRLYVHRDIKPENIRITEAGVVKLMDFGLMDQLGLPSNGKIAGTIAYLPPEVAAGGVIDGSSDLYSVGCLAYELLSGHPPFRGDSIVDVIKAHINKAPVPLSEVCPGVPSWLEDIVSKLLEKDPSKRYRSASEVIAELSGHSGIAILGENVEQRKSYLNSGVLVARETELETLKSALSKVADGSTVFVSAPAGIGKSRLVHEFKLHAQLNDVPVAIGTCTEGVGVPYEPIAKALHQLVPFTTDAEWADYGPVLIKLIPSLAQQGIQPAPALEEPGLEKDRLFDHVGRWLKSVGARSSFVLFIDDLHWADSQSLDLLNALVGSAHHRGYMVTGTFRNDELPANSPLWYSIQEGRAQQIELKPFDKAQTKVLFDAMLGRTEVTDECLTHLFEATSGNPFFLTEILRYMIESELLQLRDGVWIFPKDVRAIALPQSVQATVLGRLEQVSDRARELLTLCAAAGKRQDFELLASVSGIEESELFGLLGELVEKQFLLRIDGSFSFPHDRVREALLDHSGDETIPLWHQRIGEYLERKHAENPMQVLGQLAHHFARSNDASKAFEYLYQAGGMSYFSGAIYEAVQLWVEAEKRLSAIDHPKKETTLLELWHNIGVLGLEMVPFVAIDMLQKEADFIATLGDVPGAAAEFQRQVGELKKLPLEQSAPIFAQLDQINPYIHNEGKSAPPDFGTLIPRAVETLGFLAGAHCFACHYEQCFEIADRALSLLPDPDYWAAGIVNVSIGGSASHSGRLRKCIECGHRAWSLLKGRGKKDHPGIAIFQTWALMWHSAPGWIGLPVDPQYEQQALELARENLLPHMEGWTYFYIAYRFIITGRYKEFYEYSNLGIQAHRRAGAVGMGMLHLICGLAQGLIERGDFTEALGLIRQALDVNQIESEAYTESWLQVLNGHVKLASNDAAGAEQEFRNAIASSQEVHWCAFKGRIGLAQALTIQGRCAEARAELALLLQAVEGEEFNNPYKAGIGHRLLGEVALAEGQFAEAQTELERARAMAVEQDNPIQRGFCERSLGRLAQATGNLAQAKTSYLAAAETFESLGNQYQLRKTLPLLRSLGQPTERTHVVPAAERDTSRRATVLRERMEQFTRTFNSLSFANVSLDEIREKSNDADSLFSLILKECVVANRATGASFYLVESKAGETDFKRLTGTQEDTAGFNPQIALKGLDEGGVCQLDLPDFGDNGEWKSLSNLTLRSVVAVPFNLKQQQGLVYVYREDESESLALEDLDLTRELLAQVSQKLASFETQVG